MVTGRHCASSMTHNVTRYILCQLDSPNIKNYKHFYTSRLKIKFPIALLQWKLQAETFIHPRIRDTQTWLCTRWRVFTIGKLWKWIYNSPVHINHPRLCHQHLGHYVSKKPAYCTLLYIAAGRLLLEEEMTRDKNMIHWKIWLSGFCPPTWPERPPMCVSTCTQQIGHPLPYTLHSQFRFSLS